MNQPHRHEDEFPLGSSTHDTLPADSLEDPTGIHNWVPDEPHSIPPAENIPPHLVSVTNALADLKKSSRRLHADVELLDGQIQSVSATIMSTLRVHDRKLELLADATWGPHHRPPAWGAEISSKVADPHGR